MIISIGFINAVKVGEGYGSVNTSMVKFILDIE